eukprot:357106_1
MIDASGLVKQKLNKYEAKYEEDDNFCVVFGFFENDFVENGSLERIITPRLAPTAAAGKLKHTSPHNHVSTSNVIQADRSINARNHTQNEETTIDPLMKRNNRSISCKRLVFVW